MISTQDVETLPGTPVLDSDGDKVGDVAQVYVSDEGSEPLFVTVKTGLFGTKETFVPLDEATLVQGALHVRYDKATIKDAPRVEADDHLSDDEQDGLFDYYDQHGGAARELDRTSIEGQGGTVPAAGAAGTADVADRTDVRDDRAAADSGPADATTGDRAASSGSAGIGGAEADRQGAVGRGADDRAVSDRGASDRGASDRDAFAPIGTGAAADADAAGRRDQDAAAGAAGAYDAGGADAFGGASGGVQDTASSAASGTTGEREGYRTAGYGIAGTGATGAGSIDDHPSSGSVSTPGSVQRTSDGDGSTGTGTGSVAGSRIGDSRDGATGQRPQSNRTRLRRFVVTEQRVIVLPVDEDGEPIDREQLGDAMRDDSAR